MIVRILTASALAMTLASPVLAESSSIDSTATKTNSQAAQSLPAELKQKLQTDGFTDVKVVPSSFLVQAKDKNGDPVMMMIGPHSMTLMTEVRTNGSTDGSGSSNHDQRGESSNGK